MGLNDYPPVITNYRHDLSNTKKKFNFIQTKKILIENDSTRTRKILFQKKREGTNELATSPPTASVFSETLPTGFLTPSASPVGTPTASPPNQKKFNFLLNGNQFSHRTDHSFALYKILFDSPNQSKTGEDEEGTSIGPVDIVWFTNLISSSKESKSSFASSSQLTTPAPFFHNPITAGKLDLFCLF
jgi:hypothetical protein